MHTLPKHRQSKSLATKLLIITSLNLVLYTSSSASTSPATMQQAAGSIRQTLSANQLSVMQGVYRYFSVDECKAVVDLYGNCMGNNPSSPYGMIFSPQRPGEVASPTSLQLAQALNAPKIDGRTLSASWRMTPGRDAIIMIGVTPPRHTYFSYINYLGSRENLNLFPTDKTASALLKIVFNVAEPSTPTRRLIFGSLGNGLSNKTIKTSAYDNASGATIIIMTPDKAFEDELRSRITAIIKPMGLSPDIINALPYPADRLKLGLDAKADDFIMLARAALPENKVLADEYYRFDAGSNNTSRMTVFRVFDANNQTTTRPNLYKPMPERKQGWSEDYLKEAQATLLEGVKNYFQQTHRLTQVGLVSPGIKMSPFQGELCMGVTPRIAGSYGCLGDNPHTTYIASANQFSVEGSTPSAKNLLVAVGINHPMTKGINGDKNGKSTYTNVTAYHATELKGLVASTNLEFTGSARLFADWVPVPPTWQPLQRQLALSKINRLKLLQNQLYVTTFARNCDTQFGSSLAVSGIICTSLDSTPDNRYLPIGTQVRFFERAYMLPDSEIGPDYSELAAPNFIQFKQ